MVYVFTILAVFVFLVAGARDGLQVVSFETLVAQARITPRQLDSAGCTVGRRHFFVSERRVLFIVFLRGTVIEARYTIAGRGMAWLPCDATFRTFGATDAFVI